MSVRPELLVRAQQYAMRRGLTLGRELGAGVHGIVFAAQGQAEAAPTAIKAHERESDYRRERDVYRRLQDCAVEEIRGCAVPQLLTCDDQLWILEMTIVSRPFVLDFAGAYLDWQPDFSEEVMADWQAEKQEQFEGHWPEVQAILRELEGFGIFMLDVNPGNISFAN